MAETTSSYQQPELQAVRPYLIVGDAEAAISFYRYVFAAKELERHTTPTGSIAHAKLRFGDSIVELGEHPGGVGRAAEPLPRVGLRIYMADIDATYDRAMSAGGTGEAPSDRPSQGVRGATIYDPFGFTWWLACPLT